MAETPEDRAVGFSSLLEDRFHTVVILQNFDHSVKSELLHYKAVETVFGSVTGSSGAGGWMFQTAGKG